MRTKKEITTTTSKRKRKAVEFDGGIETKDAVLFIAPPLIIDIYISTGSKMNWADK